MQRNLASMINPAKNEKALIKRLLSQGILTTLRMTYLIHIYLDPQDRLACLEEIKVYLQSTSINENEYRKLWNALFHSKFLTIIIKCHCNNKAYGSQITPTPTPS